jgi:hypothetical protein
MDLYTYEMFEWQAFFEWQDSHRDKTDFYFAQLAGYASGKPTFTVSEFMRPIPSDRLTAAEAAIQVKAMYGKKTTNLPDGK